MKKRLLTVLLAVCLVVALGTVTAWADSTSLPEPVNEVITLEEDITLSSVTKVPGNVTLDLNGSTIDCGTSGRLDISTNVIITDSSESGNGQIISSGGNTVVIWQGGNLTVNAGKIENKNYTTDGKGGTAIYNMGTLTISGGEVAGETAVYNTSYNNGSVDGKIVCNITGGTVNASIWGVAAMGPGFDSEGNVDCEKVTVNISGGTIKSGGQGFCTNASSGQRAGYTLNMTGGTIDAGSNGTGMYLPAIGINNISGGTITAAQGIRICSGELNITGGSIISTEVANHTDLISGGSGGENGALVIGKASGGYVGDIIVNISGDADIRNTATEEGTKPVIVISDKNMAQDEEQPIKLPNGTWSTDQSFNYSEQHISVNVEDVELVGDIVRISNISGTDDEHTEDGGDTSLTIDNATVTGNVFNQSKAGGVTVNSSIVTGSVTVAEGTKGTVAVFDSNIGSKSDTGVILVNTAVGGDAPTTSTGDYVAVINGVGYTDLTSAIAAADDGDTIEIVGNFTVTSTVNLPDDVTIDGNGNTINYNGAKAGGTAILAGSGSIINDITINAGNASHAVQFYKQTGGELNNVTINGGTGTCVLVNGSTGIEIRNCTLNPGSGAYAHIEYGMGSGVTTIPSVVVEDNRFVDNEVPQIWVDNATVTAVDNVTSGEQTASELRNIIMDNITNDGYSNVIVSVVLTPGTVTDVTSEGEEAQINIPDTYDIDLVVGEGGEAKTNFSNASAGTTITITVTPDEGYELDYITVDGERISGTSFKMPDHDVTVRVYFTDGTSSLPFTDVRAGQWFYDAVAYVYTNGMMEGDSATTFNPDGTMTRAMFWAVLGRIDGATITGANWVETARSWAMAEGVSDGTDPNGLVTREQMVTMLWRYAGEPESSASLSAYTDADSVSDWAETAMRWAIDEGIITGMTDTTLVPQGTATRAQCAAIFMRFDQM